MKSQLEIVRLAEQKLAAAKCLVEIGHYDDAYYLAGYSIELLLKAMICKTMKIDDFFLFDKMGKEKYRIYKNHDYKDLFVLSGLYDEQKKAREDPDFKAYWEIIESWNETSRYAYGKVLSDVKNFINASEKICAWITKHL